MTATTIRTPAIRRPGAALALALAAALTAVLSSALPAGAQTYAVMLGERTIGQVSYAGSPGAARMDGELNNTPMGVASGAFGATSQAQSDGSTLYVGGSSKRRITVRLSGGRAVAVEVDPRSEATAASDPAAAPAGVVDPVTAFGRLVRATGCPERFAMYDGRRAIELTPTARAATDGGLTRCTIDYRVTAGPGHVSPFRVRRIGIDALYGGDGMRRMALSAGPFEVTLVRR
ncbi:MAG: hypothetical protein ACU0BF_04635 [Paracoccaceae bacterium]